MARLRTPKTLVTLFDEYQNKGYYSLVSSYGVTNINGEYLHWDKFQWRVAQGDNPELAWTAVKINRQSVLKEIPLLLNSKNLNFKFCVPDSLFAKLHHIDTTTGGGHKAGNNAFILHQEKDSYLMHQLMMEEAITSSQLEGASTTRKVAKEMLQTKRPPSDKSEQMIFNNYRLMQKTTELKDQPLSIDMILELHAIATYQAIDNNAVSGELRNNNSISVSNIYNEIAHQPPCHTSLIERLNALCEFANKPNIDSAQFIHPIIKAIILHFMIGYIHPFGDGNGRTARALFYWFMLKSGYWLFEYVSISKLIQAKRSDYDLAFLYTETDENDLTYFLYNQADAIIKAVDALAEHIAQKHQEFDQFISELEQSPILKRLKQRGLIEILKDAVKQPGRVFTAKQVAQDLDVNENTARTYLNTLVDEGLLLASNKKGVRGIIYLAPADLKAQLK